MSQLTVVYSPKGEFFEVSPHLAAELVLNSGWTQTLPTFKSEEKAIFKPRLSPKKSKADVKSAKSST